jgi:hypothetical protein
MAAGPLDEDRRVAPDGHVREARIAKVVEDDRALQRVALDVQRLPDDADGAEVLPEQLGAVLGRGHVKEALGLPLGAADEGLHQGEDVRLDVDGPDALRLRLLRPCPALALAVRLAGDRDGRVREVDIGRREGLELARPRLRVDGQGVNLAAIERNARLVRVGRDAGEQREQFVRVEDLPLAVLAAVGPADVCERIHVEHAQGAVLGGHRFVERVLKVAPHVGGRRGREPPLPRPVLQERSDGSVELGDDSLAVLSRDHADVLVADEREDPARRAAAHVLDRREALGLLRGVKALEPLAHGLTHDVRHRAAAREKLVRAARARLGRGAIFVRDARVERSEPRALSVQREARVPARLALGVLRAREPPHLARRRTSGLRCLTHLKASTFGQEQLEYCRSDSQDIDEPA